LFDNTNKPFCLIVIDANALPRFRRRMMRVTAIGRTSM